MGKIPLLKFLYIFLLLFNLPAVYTNCDAHKIPDTDYFRFIQNKGQWGKQILYKTAVPGGSLFIEKGGLTYNFFDNSLLRKMHDKQNLAKADSMFRGHALKIQFYNANSLVEIDGENPFDDYYNFFLGKDSSHWATGVFSYKKINYSNVYNGINLDIYSKQNHLKYDFVIQPNKDAGQIKLKYEGADSLYIKNGELIITTSLGEIKENRPYAYQYINGKIVIVRCEFLITEGVVSFYFPKGYDTNHQLVIDPELIFSTYSGSVSDNFGYTATFDSEGFLYAAGSVFDPGYPVTTGAYQNSYRGGASDIGITKYDTSGTSRIYSTYLGGSGSELPHSIIVNKKDQLLVYGTTSSANFPLKNPIFNQFLGGDSIFFLGLNVFFVDGTDLFVSRFNTSGTELITSTFLGGSKNDGLNTLETSPFWYNIFSPLTYNYADEVRGEIEIDKNDNVYITTSTNSSDFPVTSSSFQPQFGGGLLDGVIVKFDSSLQNILYSSYLGGSENDASYSIVVDSKNDIYVTGGTNSPDFPVTTGVLQEEFGGGRADGFITHISGDGSQIFHSGFRGHDSYDQSYFVELDRENNVYVYGQAENSGDFFIHNAQYFTPNSGQFISKFNPTLDTLVWSTSFGTGGGIPNISPTAFMVDLCNKIYLSGWGGQSNQNFNADYGGFVSRANNAGVTTGLEITGDAFQSTTDGSDFYLMVLADDASALVYGSFFGGSQSSEHVDGGTSRFDRKGKMYQSVCAGCGDHDDFPIKPVNAVSPVNMSDNCNNGVFKFDFKLPIVLADFKPAGCNPVEFTNLSLKQSATSFLWDFGDNTTSTEENPVHTYKLPGTYQVKLFVYDQQTCNLSDSIIKEVYISPLINSLSAKATPVTFFRNLSSQLEVTPSTGYTYTWSPASTLNNPNIPNPVATPEDTTTYIVSIVDPVNNCRYDASVTVNVIEFICGEPAIFIPNAFTPNDDNKNEKLFVKGTNIDNFKFSIFNRWGEKVFETESLEEGWDGYFNGMKVDPGVFVYHLEATCINKEEYFTKGNITLIR